MVLSASVRGTDSAVRESGRMLRPGNLVTRAQIRAGTSGSRIWRVWSGWRRRSGEP